jgi:hypothetical protein
LREIEDSLRSDCCHAMVTQKHHINFVNKILVCETVMKICCNIVYLQS